MKNSVAILLAIIPLAVSCGNRAQKNSGAFVSAPKNAAGTLAVTLSAENMNVEQAQNAPVITEMAAPPPVPDGPVVEIKAGTLAVTLSAENVSVEQAQNAPVITEVAAPPPVPGRPVVEIKEKMFIAQTNDVYLNPDDYLGKTIKLEGLFKREQYGGADYCFVLRYGPGCCGSDGNAGFEIAWNKAVLAGKTWPAADEWVEAAGVLKTYEEDGYPYLYLDLVNLAVLEKRGAEFVTQ